MRSLSRAVLGYIEILDATGERSFDERGYFRRFDEKIKLSNLEAALNVKCKMNNDLYMCIRE